MAEQEKEGTYSTVQEPVVHFKLISDRIIREVINPEINKVLVRISGYDLQIDFNMQYLKSVEAIEAACQGLAELARQAIMEQLLGDNKQSEQK